MVGGSPFRVQLWTMETYDRYQPPADLPAGGLLEHVRASVWNDALPAIEQLQVGRDARGRALASNPPTEIAQRVEFVIEAGFPAPMRGLALAVEAFEAEAEGTTCTASLGPYAGLAVTLYDEVGDVVDLWRDDYIPAHRFCPVNYTIRDVILYEDADPRVVVAILNVFWPSYEGNEIRYAAVALHLP